MKYVVPFVWLVSLSMYQSLILSYHWLIFQCKAFLLISLTLPVDGQVVSNFWLLNNAVKSTQVPVFVWICKIYHFLKISSIWYHLISKCKYVYCSDGYCGDKCKNKMEILVFLNFLILCSGIDYKLKFIILKKHFPHFS